MEASGINHSFFFSFSPFSLSFSKKARYALCAIRCSKYSVLFLVVYILYFILCFQLKEKKNLKAEIVSRIIFIHND